MASGPSDPMIQLEYLTHESEASQSNTSQEKKNRDDKPIRQTQTQFEILGIDNVRLHRVLTTQVRTAHVRLPASNTLHAAWISTSQSQSTKSKNTTSQYNSQWIKTT